MSTLELYKPGNVPSREKIRRWTEASVRVDIHEFDKLAERYSGDTEPAIPSGKSGHAVFTRDTEICRLGELVRIVAPHLLDCQVTDRSPINFQGDQFERRRDFNRDARDERIVTMATNKTMRSLLEVIFITLSVWRPRRSIRDRTLPRTMRCRSDQYVRSECFATAAAPFHECRSK